MHAFQVKTGTISVTELRSICEKGLLLLTITIPEMEVYFSSCFLLKVLWFPLGFVNFGYILNVTRLQHILWPFLLKMIVPRVYTGAVATVDSVL